LDPAPIWFGWGRFRVRFWKVGLPEQHTRIGLPVLQFPYDRRDRQARRTAPPVFNGVNALAFGTLFSSQGASAHPKEGTPRRWGHATHHGRHASRGRQPNSCPDPALVVRTKDTSCAERSNDRSSRDGKIPVWRELAPPVYVRNTDGDPRPSALPRVPLPGSRSPPPGHRSDPAQGFGRPGRFP